MAAIPDKLTTVVNYWPDLPSFSRRPTPGERHIDRSPVYKLDSVKQLAQQQIFLATEKAETDIDNLSWDDDDICAAVQSLRHSQFRGAVWCEMSKERWIPCDDYVIQDYDDGLFDPPRPFELYLKFGVSPFTGAALLIVSCHPSS